MKRQMRDLLLLLLLGGGLIFAFKYALPAIEQPMQGQGNCGEGFVSKDGSAPFEYDGDQNICKVFVKSGSQGQGDACYGFTFPPASQSDGCYSVRGLGSTSVRVTGGGTSSECKEISHVEFYACPRPTDTTAPTSTSTPEATDTPLPSPTSTASQTVSPPSETPTATSTSEETQETPFKFWTPTPNTPGPTPSETPDTPRSTRTPTETGPTPTWTLTPPGTTGTPTPGQPKRSVTPTGSVRLPQTGFMDARGDESAGAWIGIGLLGVILLIVTGRFIIARRRGEWQ